MLTIRGKNSGWRFILDDNFIVVKVHGQFCSGCEGTTGVCGNLTKQFKGRKIDAQVIANDYDEALPDEVKA